MPYMSATPPFPNSACHRCRHVGFAASGRGSVFLMCQKRAQKYLPQPVLNCPVYEAAHCVTLALGLAGQTNTLTLALHSALPPPVLEALTELQTAFEPATGPDGQRALATPAPEGVEWPTLKPSALVGRSLLLHERRLLICDPPGRGVIIGRAIGNSLFLDPFQTAYE